MTQRARTESRWRRAASTLLVAGGTVFLIVSGASIARAAMARDAARSHWAELEAGRAVAGARSRVEGGAAWSTARGTPVARLMIPRLGLDEVVVEGVSDDELRAGPGHMTGSVLPGAAGNAVISAHRDRHFYPLGRIVVGDTIVTDSDGGRVTWRVARLRVVDADAPTLHTSATPLLTLTTCWPIRYFGPAPERLIVEATPRT